MGRFPSWKSPGKQPTKKRGIKRFLRFGRGQGRLRQKIAAMCDCDLWCSQVSQHGGALQYAWHTLRRDREIAMKAVSNYGDALEHIAEELTSTNIPECWKLGIVQKVFSEKVSAITRMRQKYARNASKMRQNGSCFINIGKRGTFQKCITNASKMLWGRTPFGRYRKTQ